jgi:hypothetical protein
MARTARLESPSPCCRKSRYEWGDSSLGLAGRGDWAEANLVLPAIYWALLALYIKNQGFIDIDIPAPFEAKPDSAFRIRNNHSAQRHARFPSYQVKDHSFSKPRFERTDHHRDPLRSRQTDYDGRHFFFVGRLAQRYADTGVLRPRGCRAFFSGRDRALRPETDYRSIGTLELGYAVSLLIHIVTSSCVLLARQLQ